MKVNRDAHLLVSSFMRPSSILMDLWALWDSWETVELSVLTPDVATVSSWWAIGGAMSLRSALLWGLVSSSMSSWSAVSLSDASAKCGRNSENKQTDNKHWNTTLGSYIHAYQVFSNTVPGRTPGLNIFGRTRTIKDVIFPLLCACSLFTRY